MSQHISNRLLEPYQISLAPSAKVKSQGEKHYHHSINAEPQQSQQNLALKGSFSFTIGKESQGIKAKEPIVMEQSLEDEMLLTQLCLDDRNIIIYDISPMVNFGMIQPKATAFQTIKCFLDEASSIFFIELSAKTTFSGHLLSKSSLMTILDIAEELGARTVCVCLNNKTSDLTQKIQTLRFVGFKTLSPEDKLRVSKTKTHTLLTVQTQGQ